MGLASEPLGITGFIDDRAKIRGVRKYCSAFSVCLVLSVRKTVLNYWVCGRA